MKMKLMVMTLVVAMLLSMSAFAASVTYTGLTPTEINDGADYSVVVEYTASGYATGDQVTLLVLTDDDEIIFDANDATKPTNVAYIDQATITGDTGSFTFTVAKSFITSNEVYVKLGATAQATAAAGTYTFTTSGGGEEVTVTVNESISNAFGVSGLKIAKVTGADGTKTLTVAGAEVVYVKNGETPYYFVLTTGDITATDLVWSDATPVESFIGNVNGDTSVTILDATGVLNVLANTATLDTNTAKFLADSNADGSITILDATGVLNILAGGKSPIFE